MAKNAAEQNNQYKQEAMKSGSIETPQKRAIRGSDKTSTPPTPGYRYCNFTSFYVKCIRVVGSVGIFLDGDQLVCKPTSTLLFSALEQDHLKFLLYDFA